VAETPVVARRKRPLEFARRQVGSTTDDRALLQLRRFPVSSLLSLSRLIDKLNEFVGRWVAWLVLAAVLISAVNASVRKAFGTSSNAFLEIQWYLFAGVFLLAAGYTLLRQEHVKIDVIIGRFTKRTQIKVEIFGLLFFLLPFVYSMITLVWPLVVKAYVTGEMSQNAGGLIR